MANTHLDRLLAGVQGDMVGHSCLGGGGGSPPLGHAGEGVLQPVWVSFELDQLQVQLHGNKL